MPVPRSVTTAELGDLDLELVAGAWPDDVGGEFVVSVPHQEGRLGYALFDWGALGRLSLRPGTNGAPSDRFAWRTNVLRTPGRRLYERAPEQFTPGPTGYTSSWGSANAANTAPLPWGDRLFATWDAGRPVEVDPVTLEFVAEVGTVESWGGASLPGDAVLPFLLSSAHPVIDPERGCMWTVKLAFDFSAGFALAPCVIRWDGDGTQVKCNPLEGITFTGSLHTISQTRTWLLLADSGNFKADAGEVMGGERTARIDTDVPLWLVRKEQLDAAAPGAPVPVIALRTGPPSGHYYARYDDTDGISMVWEGLDLTDLGYCLRPDDLDVTGRPVDPAMVGLYNMAMGPDSIVEMVVDPERGTIEHHAVCRDESTFNVQLSALDWSTEGMSAPTLHHVDIQGCRPGNVSARAAAAYEDRIDRSLLVEETAGALVTFARGSLEVRSRWEYPDTSELITSPAFVPRDPGARAGQSRYAGSEPGGHDGYVVQPVLSDDGFRVELFDAAAVGSGPIAVLRAPGNACVPFLLHSAWMPTSGGLVDRERLRFADECTDARLAPLGDDLAAHVHAVVDDLAG